MAQRAVVVDTDLGFTRIVKDLEKAESISVLVGVQEGSKTKGQWKNGVKQEVGLNIAQYAAQNEFGTDKIPQRSFMRTAIDENTSTIVNATSKQLGLVIDGQKTLRQSLDIVGLLVTGLIQRKIREIRFPPNSPYTIALKGSSKPLIDFGAMIASIRHVIKARGTRA